MIFKIRINKKGDVEVIRIKEIPKECKWMIKNFKK